MMMKTLTKALAKIGLTSVEKRKGLYVYRPVLNGDEWAAWAEKHGVPNPIAADDFHVTVLYSKTNVSMVPDKRGMVIETGPESCYPGAFCMLGPDEDVFTFCFDAWTLHDRNYAFIRNGAESTWPTYRPHMTIGKDAAAFELSDAALSEVPRYIQLGGEVYDEIKDFKVEVDHSDPEGDGETPDMVIVIEIAASAAKKVLEEQGDLTIDQRMGLRDIAARREVATEVVKRLAANDWAPQEIRSLLDADAPGGEIRKSKEFVLQVGSLPEDVQKALGSKAVAKTSDEERMVVGIASVSTVKGKLVKDHHGDTIETQALIEFTRDIIRNGRAGKFEHEGDACNEIVQAFVLSDDIQKSLGIDLGYEPMLIEMHVPRDEDWHQVKTGNWMFSIAGRMYYIDD